MSIEPVASASAAHSCGWAGIQNVRQDLQTLQSDLQSGNVTGAQTDFATLLDDAPGLKASLQSSTTDPTSTTESSSTSPLRALSSALQAGDVNGAETDLASLQKSLGGGHHHHHHHRVESGDPSDANGSNSSSGGAINSDLQSLAGALQSGNVTAAQQAFAQLQADDPRLANNISPASSAK